MGYFTVYCIVGLIILIVIPAVMEVFVSGHSITDEPEIMIAIVPLAIFWPIAAPILITSAMLFGLFKLTVFALEFLKELYEQYKAEQK